MGRWFAAEDPQIRKRRISISLGASLLAIASFSPGRAAAETPTVAAPVPFTAVAKVNVAYIRLRPDANSPEVGLLREGANVTVTGCTPDCAAKDGWAILGTDGAIKLALLRTGAAANSVALLQPEQLEYGRTDGIGSHVYKQPDLLAPLLSRRHLPQEMAFLPSPELRAKGWLERLDGGFVRARFVAPLKPSGFRGEANPSLPLAFVLHELGQKTAGGITDRLHRYDRLPVQSMDGAVVTTAKGTLPRSAVRFIPLRNPPAQVPSGAKWVVVDLDQQTLTAYEGTRPVLATLVSTGRGPIKDHTRQGLFKVQHKMLFSNMLGKADDPYAVDRVPYTVYFDKDEALHGAYWHDEFGSELSHGCVNLSLGDSKWLFDWSPPALPAGWSDIEPKEAGLASLWVLVEPGQPAAKAIAGAPRATYSRVAPLGQQREIKVSPPIGK